MSQGRDAVIVGAVRTPIGKGKGNGALHGVAPPICWPTACVNSWLVAESIRSRSTT
ncbi:thiolase domain protein [Mycobacterium kansasii 824]|uniref:Thiolase domain protein n=1 Tax=Mycobacterium kansasii TaxID=1768 RepID=A0A1V3XUH9_MYCKA|nr:thiolase domain protein [Mycobacterium kansasii 824]OOK82864.1 thiolase domain protein [Mycobacterium kansasii]